MKIFTLLDEMHELINEKNFDEFEDHFYNICIKYAGIKEAQRIKRISLYHYEQSIYIGLLKSIEIVNSHKAKAIYFEYDLDNEWSSSFFICNSYNSIEEDDDDWASEWIKSFEGPSLDMFGEIYKENGFDRTDKAIGCTIYLIARTVVTFAKACSTIESSVPICIGFHDQDPIMRIKS